MIPVREMQNAKDFKGMSQKMIEQMAEMGEVMAAPKGCYLFHRFFFFVIWTA